VWPQHEAEHSCPSSVEDEWRYTSTPPISGEHKFHVPGSVATTFCMVVPDIVFVDPQCGTGFMSAWWYPEL